jgi:hypothetical protein
MYESMLDVLYLTIRLTLCTNRERDGKSYDSCEVLVSHGRSLCTTILPVSREGHLYVQDR